MSTADTTTETPADIRPGTAIRDPLADHLITPQNSALILIECSSFAPSGRRSA
jgi:hypothetical protein